MANDCSFWFRAVSRDSEKLHKFLACWNTEYYYEGEHLFRVFDCYEVVPITKDGSGVFYAEMAGTCAWSLVSCITAKTGSYYDGVISDFRKNPETTMLYDKFARNVNALCRKYETAIELFSEELGCGFAEQMYIDYKGNFVIDDVCDCHEYWWDRDNQTIDQFNEEYETNLTEDDFNGDDYYRVGGYAEEDYIDQSDMMKDHTDDCCCPYDFIPNVEAYKEIEKFKDFSENAINDYKETMKRNGKTIRQNIENRKSELEKLLEAERKEKRAKVKANRKGGVTCYN